MTPALGTPGAPAPWRARRGGREGRAAHRRVARRALVVPVRRGHELRRAVDRRRAERAAARATTSRRRSSGPMLHAPVWTWEVPLYFWFGGIAAGSSFVALACDLAGDEESAALARKVALGAVIPSPVLLIMDLGRPARFLNMLRIVKVRSPMSLGAWCLVTFSQPRGGQRARRPARQAARRRKRARRGERGGRRLPGLVHRRAARLDRGAAVGALAAVPRPDLRVHRDRHGRRRQPAGDHRDRPAARGPSDAARARHGRDRRDGPRARCCQHVQREAPRRPRDGPGGRPAGRHVPRGEVARPRRPGAAVRARAHRARDARRGERHVPARGAAVPLRLGRRGPASTRATTRSSPRWPANPHEPARAGVGRGGHAPQPAHRRDL